MKKKHAIDYRSAAGYPIQEPSLDCARLLKFRLLFAERLRPLAWLSHCSKTCGGFTMALCHGMLWHGYGIQMPTDNVPLHISKAP